jgi:hypothetical protein
MSVIERLFCLEIEFHRLFRLQADNPNEAWAVHTSYALQNGYEPLLRTVGSVDDRTLAHTKERMIEGRDPRDVLAAYHSLRQLVA